jgi:hypothetical protein
MKQKDALKRQSPARKLDREDVGFPPEPTPSYCLVIEQLEGGAPALPKLFRLAHGDLLGPRLAHRAVDGAFEDCIAADKRLAGLNLGDNFRPFKTRGDQALSRCPASLAGAA